MKKIILLFVLSVLFYYGCDSSTDPTSPSTGEVLVAEVAFDSIYSPSGSSTRIQTRSLTSSQLDFTGRDSARITFSYFGSGPNNVAAVPFRIYDSENSQTLFQLDSNSVTVAEKFVDTTIASPNVNHFFQYTMNVTLFGSPTPGYLVFKNLKLYKK